MTTTASTTQRSHATLGFLLFAGALSAFPPVTTDIYLPALPQLIADLHGTVAQGQHTLAAYFVGLGAGQLFYGPWADRIGRKPPMLIGVALYLAASLGCALTSSIDAMVGLRFLQAAGACSGVVVSSAIVRDRFDHQESARVLSFILFLRGLGPMIAPIVGGLVVTYLGWRAIFWTLTGFGLLIGVSVLFGMKESRPEHVAERARTESAIGAYLGALKRPKLLAYMAANGLNFSCMFAWIAAAPYLVIGQYGVPTLWFGWVFAIYAAGFMIASQVNRRLLRRHPADLILRSGAVGSALAALVLIADALSGFGGVLGVMVPLFFVVSSLGLVSTNAMAGGLATDPSRAGTVSALFGAGQFAFAGVATWSVGVVAHQTALAMSWVIVICSMGALAAALVATRGARAVA